MDGDRREPTTKPIPPGGRPPLLVLDVPPPPFPEIEFANREWFAKRIDGARGVPWVRGEPGSGTSTLVAREIERRARESRLSGALRIACWPGLRIEEALSIAGEFLRQLGAPELDEVMRQRASVPSKIRVLMEVLGANAVWIWLDDFDELLAGEPGETADGVRQFVGSWALLEGPGRLIVSTRRDAPALEKQDGFETIDLDPAAMLDPERLWSTWRDHVLETASADVPVPFPGLDRVAPAVRTPLGIGIMLSAWRAHAAGAGAPTADDANAIEPLLAARDVAELVRAVRSALGEAGRRAIDALAVGGQPSSRGALRAIGESVGIADLEERGAEELRRFGLLEVGDGHRIGIHPLVREIVQEIVRAGPEAERLSLHRALAARLVEGGSRSRSLWDFYRAFTHLLEAGDARRAYEAQKVFSEEFLACGFVSLTRSVFEACLERVESPYREVVLGNLAIIAKSQGRYDEAIELYRESLVEFTLRRDLSNCARVHHQIGNTLYLRGDLPKALENYRRSLEVASEANDDAVGLLARVQIANVEFTSGNLDGALESYRGALASAEKMGHPVMVTSIHVQMAQAHMQQKRYQEAREELDIAARLASECGDRRSRLKIDQLHGLSAKAERDYDTAVERFGRAVEHARVLGDVAEQANAHIHIGAVEESRLRYPAAVRAYVEARIVLERVSPAIFEPKDREALARNLETVQERIDGVARAVGDDAFERILRGLADESEAR